MGDQTRERRAADAVEDGLRLYSQGDLRAALGVWRGALEMDPDNKRARDYVKYVEEHFDLLVEKIRTARARRASEERVSTAMATGSAIEMVADDGDDEYDAFEVAESDVGDEPAEAEVTVEKVPETKRTMQGWDSKVVHRDAAARMVESVDEGWDLDGLDEFIGSGTSGGVFPKTQLPDASESADLATSGDDSLMSDPEAGEVTLPAPRAYKISVPPPPALQPFDISDFSPDLVETVEGVRGIARTAPPEPPPPIVPAAPTEPEVRDVRVSFRNSTAPPPARLPTPAAGPDEETMDRQPGWTIPATDGDVPPLEPGRRAPTEDPTIGTSSVEVDDQLLSFEDQTIEGRRVPLSSMEDAIADLGPGAEPGDPDGERPTQLYSRPSGSRAPQTISLPLASTELAAELDDAVAGEEGTPDTIAARVRWLFERASRELKAGRFSLAAVAVDLALSEHPDSAVAQKAVQSSRDLVYEVYRNYLGDLGLVPALAQPIDTIPVSELDHRAAFLLTRVDGVLTLEDILDVSGMARLEAYRHLCRLLMRGFLSVR
ncbi:MAG TPA: hypothetical protein VMZ28_08285 [Kofleriaceae bacterium]|nr:hypothetical protein [Kofleriaceae bacterium]